MKRKLAIVLAAAVAVSALTVSSFADDYTEVSLVIDGEEVESDQPAVIVSSRTMVPVRVIAEALGCEVNWDAETKTASFEKDALTVSLTIGETAVSAAVDGVESEVEIDAPAVIINERTMVPARFISEFFSAEVEWDAETKTVTITSPVIVADDTASDAAVDTETEEETEADEASEEAAEAEEAEAADEADEEAAADEEAEESEEAEASEDSEEADEEAEEETSENSETDEETEGLTVEENGTSKN